MKLNIKERLKKTAELERKRKEGRNKKEVRGGKEKKDEIIRSERVGKN